MAISVDGPSQRRKAFDKKLLVAIEAGWRPLVGRPLLYYRNKKLLVVTERGGPTPVGGNFLLDSVERWPPASTEP